MADHALTKFGQLARQLRMQKMKTMADQHRDLGHSPSDISKYETGSKTPSPDYVSAFSKWIGASFIDQQELIRASFTPKSQSIMKMTRSEGNRLFRTVNSLKPDQVRQLGLRIRKKDG